MVSNNSRLEIASRIRELRECGDATVDQTAASLGISEQQYLDFESGTQDVPISALYGIAGRFGVDMTDLLTGKSPNLQQYCVVREGKGPEIERFPGYRFQSLAFDFQNRLFEPLLVTLDPAMNQSIGLVTHSGQEFNLILKGRVVVTGLQDQVPPGLFRGYYRDAAATEKVWHEGIYETGDVAWRDEAGYYWYVGRSDDVIKCSGYRIGPFEVESALQEHRAVLECAVTAVPDPMRGQVVKATIVLARGYVPSDALVKELQDHVKHTTAPYKYPRIIEFVAALPKTVSGKIRRVEIRDRDGASD